MNGGGWAVWPFDKLRTHGSGRMVGCEPFSKLKAQDGSVGKKPFTLSMSKCVSTLNYA